MTRLLYTTATVLIVLLAICTLSFAAYAKRSNTITPYSVLEVSRDDKTGVVDMVLTTHGLQDGEKRVTKTVADGVEKWEYFNKWYEDLFGLTYLDSDYKRLWSQLRKRCATFARYFVTDEMLNALEGSKLLVLWIRNIPSPQTLSESATNGCSRSCQLSTPCPRVKKTCPTPLTTRPLS